MLQLSAACLAPPFRYPYQCSQYLKRRVCFFLSLLFWCPSQHLTVLEMHMLYVCLCLTRVWTNFSHKLSAEIIIQLIPSMALTHIHTHTNASGVLNSCLFRASVCLNGEAWNEPKGEISDETSLSFFLSITWQHVNTSPFFTCFSLLSIVFPSLPLSLSFWQWIACTEPEPVSRRAQRLSHRWSIQAQQLVHWNRTSSWLLESAAQAHLWKDTPQRPALAAALYSTSRLLTRPHTSDKHLSLCDVLYWACVLCGAVFLHCACQWMWSIILMLMFYINSMNISEGEGKRRCQAGLCQKVRPWSTGSVKHRWTWNVNLNRWRRRAEGSSLHHGKSLRSVDL